MPGSASLVAFNGLAPPWSLASLDANFTGLNNLVKSANNYTNYLVDTGAVNAYVVTFAVGVTATLAAGLTVDFTTANPNTGTATINVNGLGAVTILRNDGSILSANDIRGTARVVYNGTNFILTSPYSLFAGQQKSIYGLTYANGTDATNDINIASGGAMDATGVYLMTLSTALGKQSDVVWAVGGTTGAPAGWLDTGVVGNNDYYIWLIARTDTGVVDSICSLSSTAPTMPANYTMKRLVGWFKRAGGTIVAFHTYELEGGGLEFNWDAPPLDINLTNTLTTSRRTDALSVPLNLSVNAKIRRYVNDAGASYIIVICNPDETDAAPSVSVSPLTNTTIAAAGSIGGEIIVRTSAAGLIAARATLATVDTYRVATVCFYWARRN